MIVGNSNREEPIGNRFLGTENDHREEEINTSPLEADGDLEVFDFAPTPFTFFFFFKQTKKKTPEF